MWVHDGKSLCASFMCFPAASIHTASEVVAVVAQTESLSSCCGELCPADTGPPLLLFPQTLLLIFLKTRSITERKTQTMTRPAPQPIDLNEC